MEDLCIWRKMVVMVEKTPDLAKNKNRGFGQGVLLLTKAAHSLIKLSKS